MTLDLAHCEMALVEIRECVGSSYTPVKDQSAAFGVYCSASEVLGVAEFAQTIERLGFETFWAGDGPTNRHPYYDPFIAMTYAAAATKRLKVGSCVALLPFFHPVRLAQTVASVDVLSGGRVVLGVGVGGEFEKQFEAFGVPMEGRGKRTNEYIEILKNLWTEKVCNYTGTFYRYQGITMELKPVQQPHPPLWIGGRLWGGGPPQEGARKPKGRTAAVRRAAKYGQGWFPYNISLEQLKESLVLLRKYATDFGRDVSEITVGVDNIWMLQDGGAGERKSTLTGDAYARLLKYGFVGTPREIVPQLERFVDAGARHFVCNLSCEPPQVPKQLEIISQEIIPHFR